MVTRLPSSNELLVLRLLRDGPSEMYGLELVKASEGKLGRASIYVTLSRMDTKGFLKRCTPLKDEHPGMPRPLYRITALGERVLRAAEAAQDVLGDALARAAV
jgi:DNA-binding PadR family transcriptional regulator